MRKNIAKLLLFVFLCLSVFVSCNQNMLAVGSAVKNFVTTPYRGVRDAIANRRYKRAVKKTQKALAENPEGQNATCIVNPIEKVMDEDDEKTIDDILSEVRPQVCSCKAWGTCSTKECSCEYLCPETLAILQRTDSLQDLSKPENSLNFRNDWSPNFENTPEHEMTAGFCWGHASITSKFNRLAFFDNDKQPPFDKNSPDPEVQNQLIDYYREQIDKVLDNKVADFPGIKNLQELSDIPGLEEYLYDKMGEAWADNAMTFQGLATVMQAKPMKRKKNEKFFEDVKAKIDNHQQPQILFTKEGAMGYTHAVLVSHYIKDGDDTILCIRDNNYPPSSNKDCRNRMELKEDGTINYNKWGTLGGTKLAHNDNREAVSQMGELVERCRSDKGCSEE